MGPLSDECDRRGPGAGGAAELWVGEDQGELAHAVGRELREVEVLDDEDAVADVEDLRHLERARGVLGRNGAVAPGVAARERDAVLDEPAGDVAARAGLARALRLDAAPVLAPARVEENGVTRCRVDAREVLDADHVARAAARGVDEPAAG